MGNDLEIVGEMTDHDLLDSLAEESGHVAPPDNYITVDDYMERVRARGGRIARNTALVVLLRKMKAGELEGCKMAVDGRQRWVFWSNNHSEGAEGG